MAPTHRTDASLVANTGKPGLPQTMRPVCSTAGKGGHAAQLQKTAIAITQTQRALGPSKDLLANEPINKTAPTSHRPRKKKTGKKPAEVSVPAGYCIIRQLPSTRTRQ